jgi:hypothetical protein
VLAIRKIHSALSELPDLRHLRQLYTLGEADLVRSANAVLFGTRSEPAGDIAVFANTSAS